MRQFLLRTLAFCFVFVQILVASDGLALIRRVENTEQLYDVKSFEPTISELEAVFPVDYRRLVITDALGIHVLVVLTPDSLLHAYGARSNNMDLEHLVCSSEFVDAKGKKTAVGQALGKYHYKRNPSLVSVLEKSPANPKSIKTTNDLGFVTQELPKSWPDNSKFIRLRFHPQQTNASTASRIIDVYLTPEMLLPIRK